MEDSRQDLRTECRGVAEASEEGRKMEEEGGRAEEAGKRTEDEGRWRARGLAAHGTQPGFSAGQRPSPPVFGCQALDFAEVRVTGYQGQAVLSGNGGYPHVILRYETTFGA